MSLIKQRYDFSLLWSLQTNVHYRKVTIFTELCVEMSSETGGHLLQYLRTSAFPTGKQNLEDYICFKFTAGSIPTPGDVLADFLSWLGENKAQAGDLVWTAKLERAELAKERDRAHHHLTRVLELRPHADAEKQEWYKSLPVHWVRMLTYIYFWTLLIIDVRCSKMNTHQS